MAQLNNIVSPEFRGSFVHVLKPRRRDDGDGDPTYEMTIVLPKADRETTDFIANLEERFEIVMKDVIGKVIPFEKCKHYPIRDGDDMDGDEFKGCWVISTKNKRKPGIMVREEDGSRRAINDESEIYSGAWYHASVRPYAWENKYGKGVSVSLEGVLKIRDDEAFGGSFHEDDFNSVSKGGKRRDREEREERRPSRDDDRSSRRRSDDKPPF